MNPSENDQFQICAAPFPFSNAQMNCTAPYGETIEQIVMRVCPPEYRHSGVGAVVFINGQIVPRDMWARIKPKAHTLVNIRIVPLGGGGGRKNPLATILSIAVAIAAPYAAGAILGSGIIASTQAGALFIKSALTAAIGMLGRMAVSALVPPPKPSNAGTANNNDAAESPTQFIEGARNVLDPFGVIPCNLGTNRMFPKQAARPYTESMSNEQYVRQLFTWGYGEQVVISNLRIGESSLSEFDAFELEHKLEGNLHEGTALFSNDVYQDDYSVLLAEADGYQVRTTQQNVDEAIVDLTFPQGMVYYREDGTRGGLTNRFEITYALTGTSPQVWSTGALAYTDYAGDSLTINPVTFTGTDDSTNILTRTDTIVINLFSGQIRVIEGQDGYIAAQPIPDYNLRLATVLVTTTRDTGTGILSTDIAVSDSRQESDISNYFETSSDFEPSRASASVVDIEAGALKADVLNVFGNTREAFRRSLRFVFPARGQYDIRARRITADNDSDRISDQGFLTAIKSVTYVNPVNLEGLNGTAMRIRATNQLNGAVDQFNADVSTVIPDYDAELDTWVPRVTSNPASIARYVLQGRPNAKALPDSELILSDYEAWHQYCKDRGYTYNRVIDFEISVDSLLRDICLAGSATPAIVDGKRTIAVDRDKEIITQIITPRNSSQYSGEMTYPRLPHALRVQFRNKDKGYQQDERIVYADGYDETNATLFESMEYQSCTNSDLAYKAGRRYQAVAQLRPETHTWVMDFENLVAIRGDRVKFVNDAPLVGIGDARIKEVFTDGNSPANVTGVSLDDTIAIPTGDAMYYMRIRLGDGSQLYKEISASIGEYTQFNFVTPFSIIDAPAVGDLCYVVEAGEELDLIITRIEYMEDLQARITGVNYAQPEIQNAEFSPIPVFDSHVSTPLELIRPLAPILAAEPQSNESVMVRQSDGSLLTRAIFTLENPNENDMDISVKIKVSGTDIYTSADILEASAERLILTGMDDGRRYDLRIYYKPRNGFVYSKPLEINSFLFVGASGRPANVQNFTINVNETSAFFRWDANEEIDISHYDMRYSGVFTGATWETAQSVDDTIYENRLVQPFLPGTYLIKAIDLSGNESLDATAIITFDPGNLYNSVAVITEDPTFAGVTDNVTVSGGEIYLTDTSLGVGIYYFDNDFSLGDVYSTILKSIIEASGVYTDSPVGNNDVFAFDDIFAVEDVFGIGVNAWAVSLEYRTTQDPSVSPVVWSDWLPVQTGTVQFHDIQFRLKLYSYEQNISPLVSVLRASIDMPDRIVRGEDIAVPDTGATITFDPEFLAVPAIVITIQNAEADDKIEFISKTAGGFEIKVYNVGDAGYVTRSIDYIASGYGRKRT